MTKLRLYLTINYAFSAFSGTTMLLFSEQLNQIFHFSDPLLFPIIGANLLVFAVFVFYVTGWQIEKSGLVKLISLMDAGWVVGSVFLLLFGPFGISPIGLWIIGIVAVWIGFLGYKQYSNL
ncbi:MAG: hypothetical protein R8N23_07410 [Reichenbachiella sp.]|uniref:hypothetical protein n=1 Tax=Reichenbachiella sp. TaxID=2184521 RepID=UPI002966B149|nr:hypothetical protein [Reichenbachiella sp.]MDW3209676.1 hypothetical protein [Reichenbachiella sp.]